MSDLHRRQVAGTKHGHGIAHSDETVAVCRHDAGELPATALKVLLECGSVGDAEQLADVRTRFAGTGELAGGLSDAQHRAGGQRVQRGEFDGDLFSQVSRLQAQGFQRGPVHDEDLPVAPGFFLAVHIAFQPEIHQGPGPADGLRPDRKSTRLNSSHTVISYAVFCLKKKKKKQIKTKPEKKKTKTEHII